MLKIAIAQINPCVGGLDGNREKIISGIRKARSLRCDIVIFPELALAGYPPEDLLHKPQFIRENQRQIKLIAKETKGIIALAGFVASENKILYNAAALFHDGALKEIYRKIHLPNYGVFDEKRYFAPGDEFLFFYFKGHKIAVSICEDIWEKSYVGAMARLKPDIVLNLSASPFHLGKIAAREKILKYAAQKTKSFVVYCNLVGGQDELVFDGTSKVVAPSGASIHYSRSFSEDFSCVVLDKYKKYPAQRFKLAQDEEVFNALVLGLRDYVAKNGFKKTALGISGGIDSAVVAGIAVAALGKENVVGVVMPSQYTSAGTFADALKICVNLGIKHHVVSIDKVFKTYTQTLRPFFKGAKADITEENLQARIRGSLLMAFSNKFGYLILNTGNKSEVSCGYCTLYGDMIGGFGLLKDVYKDMVYKLAEYINRSMGEPIPRSAIRRAPSAELRPNQKDSDSLPPYHELDPVLKLYVEEELSADQIVGLGAKRRVVERVIRMVDRNEYKRRQSPPGVKITPRAFGKDRRMPITNNFKNF